MELSIFKREDLKKSNTKKIRLEGKIPCVLYFAGSSENIYILKKEYEAALRKTKKGRLSTTIFTLKSEKETFKAILKDICYQKTTYNVLHLDFLKLIDDKFVNIKIPIELENKDECIGVKQGGELRQILRYVKVKCLPKHILPYFPLDVSDLEVLLSKRVEDIDIDKNIILKTGLKEVVALIVKK